MEALLGERRDAGAAMVFVTHDHAQAARLAHRVLTLEQGRITENEAAHA